MSAGSRPLSGLVQIHRASLSAMSPWRPVVGLVLLAFACSSLAACGGGSGSADGATPASAAAAGGDEGVPGFGHVFLIIGENTSASQVTAARAPYLTSSIKPRAAWLTRYFALTDGSLGNYVAMLSGQFTVARRTTTSRSPTATSRVSMPVTRTSTTSSTSSTERGVSWQEWNESAANPCDMFDHGTTWYKNGYVSHHSPALYFDDIQAHHSSEDVVPSAECRKKVLPAGTTAPNDMSAYNAALASGNVARFNFVVPNDCENGHDLCGGSSSVGQFDDFLSREIPKVEASPAFGSNGTIVVTWDEGSDPPLNPKHVVMAVIGPNVKPGVYAGGALPTTACCAPSRTASASARHLAKAAKAKPINQIWK